MTEWEAFFEYTGYGDFSPDPKVLEGAKKDFYRRNASTWSREKELDFKRQFEINEPAINHIVLKIHETISFQEAPLYLPEIIAYFPEIALRTMDAEIEKPDTPILVHEEATGRLTIEYPVDVKMRPFIRYRIARAMARYFLKKEAIFISSDQGDHASYINEIQANLFAAKLLTPAPLVRKELSNLDASKDIVTQLADVFCMSKTYMNGRVKEILEKYSEL